MGSQTFKRGKEGTLDGFRGLGFRGFGFRVLGFFGFKVWGFGLYNSYIKVIYLGIPTL